MTRNIWLFSKYIDLWLLALPVWICWAICFLVPDGMHSGELPLWFWVLIIVGVDVSHVWSTIFRTYLDKGEFNSHKATLIYTPLLALIVLFSIASISIMLFWTVLAYVALYHFMKQQYGFMQLYRAKYGKMNFKKRVSDKTAIYMSMLFPVLYWHINTQRNFSWFVEGDFFNLSQWVSQIVVQDIPLLSFINQAGSIFYFALLGLWLVEELYTTQKHRLPLALGKVLWVLTTACNWYLGIVYFNSDFAFSLTNVIAHGIPYLVLLFFYVERKKEIQSSTLPYSKIVGHVAFMSVVILLLAFGEEYFWDMFLFRDNVHFFESILSYPFEALRSSYAQAFAFALLSLPQVTHYVLDGFIWKKNSKNPYLGEVLFKKKTSKYK